MSEPRSVARSWSAAASAAARPYARVGAGTETVGHTLTDGDLHRRVRDSQRLHVRVDSNEVDLSDPRVDHPVEGIQPCSANTDDADRGEIRGSLRWRHPVKPWGGLEHRLEVARRRT